MDLTEYLWARVERGDGVGLLVRAMNTPAVRDALLRHAARTGQWELLRRAAVDAADAAPMAGWSAAGPRVVAGLCHWMLADQLLSLAVGDRAAGLVDSVRHAWSDPSGVAAAIAASPPLTQAAADTFNDEFVAEAGGGPGSELLVELAEQMVADPELLAAACNNPPVRDALLRRAARTGEWEELQSAAADAAEAVTAEGGADPSGPAAVAAVCAWIRRDPAASDLLSAAAGHELADLALAHWDNPAGGAELLANLPMLADADALQFAAERDVVFGQVVVRSEPGRDRGGPGLGGW